MSEALVEPTCHRCKRKTPYYLAHIPTCEQCARVYRGWFAALYVVPAPIAARYLAEFQPGLTVEVKPEHQVKWP